MNASIPSRMRSRPKLYSGSKSSGSSIDPEASTWCSAGNRSASVNRATALAGTVARLAAGERDPGLPAEVHRLAALVDGRGACHHPDGSVRMLRTALHTFGTDVQAHLAGWCTAHIPLESR